MFTGPSGDPWGDQKQLMGVIMTSGVSAGRTWPAETPDVSARFPSGNPEGLALLGEPVWVGAFGWGGQGETAPLSGEFGGSAPLL